VYGHLGGKEDNRHENKQITEQIGKERDEIEIIFQDNIAEGSLMVNKIVNLFGKVKNHGNENDKAYCQEKGSQKFSDNIDIESLEHLL
jgi:hypothetical protein